MPTDPSAAMVGPDQLVPCNRLSCEHCRAPVLHLDGLEISTSSSAGLAPAHASRDPLEWLSLRERRRGARAYACACHHANVHGIVEAGHLDTRGIDTWACSGHPGTADDAVEPWRRRAMLGWDDAIARRLPLHLERGGWLALHVSETGGALEGLPDGRVREHAWTGEDARVLSVDETRALLGRIARLTPRSVARQLAPLRSHPYAAAARGCAYAVMRRSWVHGMLDGETLETTCRDVPSLLAAVRERLPRGIDLVTEPALLGPKGFTGLDEYETAL